jgi:hypothetical protein
LSSYFIRSFCYNRLGFLFCNGVTEPNFVIAEHLPNEKRVLINEEVLV